MSQIELFDRTALDALGISLRTLFAAGAIFAIGIGFAMQNIAQNFVSGVILLLERTIKPGDVLEVEGRFVRVEQTGIRATVARTLDDEEIIIPNSTIVASDMALVKRTLERVAAEMPWRVRDKEPLVLMAEFADSSSTCTSIRRSRPVSAELARAMPAPEVCRS